MLASRTQGSIASMDKFLLVVLVAGIAFATNERDIYERTLSEEIETAYRAGKTYVYKYETQVVSGLPLTAPVYSIVKVKCTVNMEFKTASKVVMKIDDISLFKMNGRLEAIDPTDELVPEEVLEPITGGDTTVIQRAFSLPVKFRYTNGFVSGIVSESEDPEWSLNFKKGCLGLLQVNLEKAKLIEESEPIVSRTYAGETVNEAYTVMETTPAGECACTYIVEDNTGEEAESEESTIEITKVRNFEECLERPTFFYDTLGPERCEECDTVTKPPLEVRSEVNYVLTGTREQFFIQTVVAESSYILTVQEKTNGYAATFVNQTMEFISTEVSRASLEEPRVPSECPEGVKAIVRAVERRERSLIAENAINEAPAELREVEIEEEREEGESEMFIEEAVGALRAVAIDFKEGITEEGPTFSMIAVDILRSGNEEELRTIWRKFHTPGEEEEEERRLARGLRRRFIVREEEEEEDEDEEEEEEIRRKVRMPTRERMALEEDAEPERIDLEEKTEPVKEEIKRALWHLMPYVGTVPAVKVVCEAIKEGHIPERVLHYSVLPMIGLAAEPVPENLELLLGVVKRGEVTTRPGRRAAWLSVGVLMNRMDDTYTEKYEELEERLEKAQMILANEEMGKPRRQLEEIAERTHMMKKAIAITMEYVGTTAVEALTELLKSTEVEEKIIALKAIGNAGVEEMLPLIVETLADEELPVVVRQQAVYSMRRIAEETPKEVLEALLPVFMDDDEEELIRIAAFTTILKCDPPAPYLYMIARSLDDEENPLVGSYVYSYLSELSNSTFPCVKSLAVNASMAMKFATGMPEDVHSSYVYHWSKYLEKYNTAGAMEMSVIGSRDSVLPRGASVSIDGSILGYVFDICEFGVQSRGVQTIMDKVIGPNGILTEGKSLFDVLRPKRSAFSAMEVVEDISRKLKLVERELEETELDMFIKYQGNELTYLSLDSEWIKELVERGTILTSISEESLRSGYDIDLKVPQPLGGMKVVLPTEAGLPLTIHAHVATMASVTGTWKAEVKPSLFESFRRGIAPTGLKAEVDIKPSFAADVIASMGVDTAFYKTAVLLTNRAFVHNIQIAGTIEADFEKGKWFSSFETPTEEKKFAGFRSRPTTYFVKTNDHTLTESMEVVAPEGGVLYPVNVEPFTKRNFGTVFALRAFMAEDESVPGEVLYPMAGKVSYLLLAKPDESPAEKLNINLQVIDKSEEEEEDEEDEEEEGGVVSSILDKFWWGEDSEDTDNWEEDFDLRVHDLSIAAVAEETRAPLIEGGRKYAIAISIEGEGTEPPKELKWVALSQRAEDRRRTVVNTKMTTTWLGYKHTTHMDMIVNFHRNETTVGQLLNPEYQHMIKEHIKAASLIDPVTEETVSRTNPLFVRDWQRIMTEIRESGVPTDSITEDIVSPAFNPTERALYERVEQIIVKQELIARRVADPVLQTIRTENEERIAERLEDILAETREVRREAERAIVTIRDRIAGRVRDRKVFIIALKVHQAIRHHKDILERVEVVLKASPIRERRRVRIERELESELEGIERLIEIRRRIVDELDVPAEERYAPNVEINPEINPSMAEVNEVITKQIEIAKEIEKIKDALKEGAERSSVIPQVKQIMEHCKEIVGAVEAVTSELRGIDDEAETTIVPHLRLFKALIQEDQLLYHIKEIVEMIKFDPTSPVEDVMELTARCEEHTVKLDAILGIEAQAYDEMIVDTAERTAESVGVPELPVYMTAYVNVTYVNERTRTRAIQFKIWADKSLEQLIYETRQAEPLTRDPEITRILEDEEISEEREGRIRKEINTLRKIKVEVEYSPEVVEKVESMKTLEWIETYLKARDIWELSYGAVNVTTPRGRAKLDIQFSRSGETVSYAIMTPRATTKFWAVKVPSIFPAGVSVMERERGIFAMAGVRIRTEPNECSYRSENVETFDGKVYSLTPVEGCERLLAMDCSPRKTFAIMLKESGPEKIIRMVVEKQIVEITHRPSRVMVQINGARSRLLDEEPLIIRGEGEYERPIVLRVEKKKEVVVVRAVRRGIAVRLLPEEIRVEASPFFRSKVCGLCGNFDGQWRDEFEDPERRVHARPESFGVSYLIPHETCDRKEIEDRYPPEIISRPEGCTPIRRNEVRERRRGSRREACLSTRPVRRCPIGCEPEGEIRRRVGFHCLPGEDPTVQEMIEASESRILRELRSRENDKWEIIIEPSECIRE